MSEVKQILLFDEATLAEAKARSTRLGDCTGMQLAAQEPELYEMVLQCLAEGMSNRQIHKKIGVGPKTVSAIRQGSEHQEAREAAFDRLGRKFADFADMAVERLIDEVDEMSVSQLPVAAGIAASRAQELRNNGQRIVVAIPEVKREDLDWEDFLKKATQEALPGEQA